MNTVSDNNKREKMPQPEAVEGKVGIEKKGTLSERFPQYADKTLKSITATTEATLEGGAAKLKGTGSIGYSVDQIRKFMQEKGIDTQLLEVANRIKEQAKLSKDKIQEVSASESAESQAEKEKTMEKFQAKRGGMIKDILTSEIVSSGLDLVPFAGGGKMLVESIAGGTLSGQQMTGKERIIHGALGAGSLVIDFIGIGEIEKGGLLVGKGIVLVEKAGSKLAQKGIIKGAKIFETTAKFMAKNPQLVEKAELFAEAQIKKQAKNITKQRGKPRKAA
ncbi:MAG: hypothetical protein NTX82_06995 [Candidatus Parcubacteria bacterium]|nr:hypothetical protein [Candidatus Parcubacteria bacterium]